ncbi:ragulator complex protein LAMTOR5 homolog [Ornithodoros turicata]|uniref:Late endosomal/lysosomal adaptor and MAPK and MTOR activator 5 n=1 Tax=Ornithodoros turicata TaxID=34597 RepID=A0A2R5LF58_9ACAR
MEAPLVKCLNDVITSGALGVACADRHGLALHMAGQVQPRATGAITSLASLAKALDPSESAPTIHLESESLNVLIQQKDQVSVAVYSVPDHTQ